MTLADWDAWWERFAANLRAVGVTLETVRDDRGKVTRWRRGAGPSRRPCTRCLCDT